MAAQVLTAAAAKGGTGKTVTIGSLAFAAAGKGKKVLCIDLDPQASLSIWFNADFSRPNAFNVIEEGTPAAEAVQETPAGLDLIAGHSDLTDISSRPASGDRLNEALKPLRRQYDVIFIDTSAAMGAGLNSALFASNGLIIPLFADFLSLQAFYQISDRAAQIRKSRPLKMGIVLTQYDPRGRFIQYMQGVLKEQAEKMRINAPILGTIRRSVNIWEAIGLRQSIFKYAPKSKPAADYMALYKKMEDLKWI